MVCSMHASQQRRQPQCGHGQQQQPRELSQPLARHGQMQWAHLCASARGGQLPCAVWYDSALAR
jgi:hypothetical protein